MRLLALLLFYINIPAFAQELTIKDMVTNEPIPFVTVSLFQEGNNVFNGYCNEKGAIVLDAMEYDSIRFSCVGFFDKIIEKTDIKTSEVFLVKATTELAEVVITKTNSKSRKLIVGLLDTKKKIGYTSVAKGHETVLFIKNETGNTSSIRSFLFRVKKRMKNRTVFKIHFYEKNVGVPQPGEEIIFNNITAYRSKKSSKLLEVDLSSYNLYLPPEGIFVGVEWVGIIDDNGNFVIEKDYEDNDTIEYNDAVNESLTFVRNRLGNSVWGNTAPIKENFNDIFKFKNWPNASFGLKIAIHE